MSVFDWDYSQGEYPLDGPMQEYGVQKKNSYRVDLSKIYKMVNFYTQENPFLDYFENTPPAPKTKTFSDFRFT